MDLLSIVEHPKFIDFYNSFIEGGLVAEIVEEPGTGGVLGDMITVDLKENYELLIFLLASDYKRT